MNDNLRSQIYNSMSLKETDELIDIWQQHNSNEWTDLAFDVVEEILRERLGDLPRQSEFDDTSKDVIMEDQKDEQKKSEEENIQTLPISSSLSENLTRKYPYLTAYIGFILLYLLSGVVAGLIFTIPQYVIVGGFSPFTELFIGILQVVLGFYAFRYIVNKHILPFSSKS